MDDRNWDWRRFVFVAATVTATVLGEELHEVIDWWPPERGTIQQSVVMASSSADLVPRDARGI